MKKMSDIECPYCGENCGTPDEHEDEGVCCEMQCPTCEKNFVYSASYSVHYESHEAPCLNDGEHLWNKMCGAPREFFERKYRCKYCDEEKQFTEEEIKTLGLEK